MSEDNEVLKPLTEEEIAELDSAYSPFPSFGDWPADSPTLVRWDLSCEQFRAVAVDIEPDILERARGVALRAAAFDTGAIEGLYPTNRGLTFTVAEQAAAWEQKVEAQGPDARQLFEAQLRAFELVLDHVTHEIPEISQAWIRRIHEETTAAQESYVVHTPVGPQKQALPQGKYKSHPNHVRTEDGSVHAYAPVAATQDEMQRFLTELQSEAFREAHPIIQASYAHYAFVAIHPFADGNGRVARALASIYTYRSASVPLLILNEHRESYFAALAEADQGNAQTFVDFIGEVARDAVELVMDTLRTALAPQPEEILHELDELNRLDSRSQERNAIALELANWINTVASEIVEELDGAASVKLSTEPIAGTTGNPPKGYRRIPGQGIKSVRFTASTVVPKKLEVVWRMNVFISDDPKKSASLLLRAGKQSLGLDLDDLWPSATAVARQRIENFVRRLLGNQLKQLRDEAIRKS